MVRKRGDCYDYSRNLKLAIKVLKEKGKAKKGKWKGQREKKRIILKNKEITANYLAELLIADVSSFSCKNIDINELLLK